MGYTTPQFDRGYWNCRPNVPLRQPVRLEPLDLVGGQTQLVHHLASEAAGAPVLVLHGIESHPLWFLSSADDLAARGHEVYLFQRRGSGQSRENRGHARSTAQILADVDAAVAYVRAQTHASRVNLVGISWGGKLAAAYALTPSRACQLAGLTLVAPGIAPRVNLPRREKLQIALSALVSSWHPFSLPLEDAALFTDNTARQGYIRNDPFRLHEVSAGFLFASWRLDRRLTAARPGALNLPVHLLLASRDLIIDNDRTREILSRIAGDRLHVQELEGAHTLEFEKDPQPFYEALAETVANVMDTGEDTKTTKITKTTKKATE